MGIVLNPGDCEVIKMKELKDLVKRFIEKKSMQPKDNDKELTEMKRNIEEQGYDPEAIYDDVKNLEPEQRDNALENMFKNIGKEETWRKPIIVNNDKAFLSKSVHTRETEQGMERRVDKSMIVAACKRVITEEEIGSQCSVCNKYECKEHVFFCNSCGNSLCIRHVHSFTNEEGKNIHYCEECYKLVTENQDTWKTIPRMPWKQEKEK